jgi:hypothetical protein
MKESQPIRKYFYLHYICDRLIIKIDLNLTHVTCQPMIRIQIDQQKVTNIRKNPTKTDCIQPAQVKSYCSLLPICIRIRFLRFFCSITIAREFIEKGKNQKN